MSRPVKARSVLALGGHMQQGNRLACASALILEERKKPDRSMREMRPCCLLRSLVFLQLALLDLYRLLWSRQRPFDTEKEG